jgi:hypothetical protein
MTTAPAPNTNDSRQPKASRSRECDIVFLPDIFLDA